MAPIIQYSLPRKFSDSNAGQLSVFLERLFLMQLFNRSNQLHNGCFSAC
jgi:hypothetical protein